MADSEVSVQSFDETTPTTVEDTAEVDCESLTGVSAKTVQRQRIQVTGSALLEIAAVKNAAPTTEYGLITRNIPSGTQTVAIAAGTNNIGDVDVLSIAAGDNNIGNVDIVTMPAVTVTGVSTLAEQQTQTTALQLIDDTIKTDDAPFTPATDKVSIFGAEFDDTTPDSVDEGDAGALRMSSRRELYVQIRDQAGNERGVNVTAGNALKVDGSAQTQPISAVSLPLPTGASTLAEQQTQTTALSAIQTAVELIDNTIAGSEQQVDIVAALPAGTNNIGDVDIASTVKSSASTAHAQTAVGVAAVQLLASNASRKRFMIQNTGTTVIKVGFGTTDPTATSYHVALEACGAADDGTGGFYIDEMWTGVVEALSSAAGGTVVVTELT